jgi:poly(3-hydroxybutyrate) depolymerase
MERLCLSGAVVAFPEASLPIGPGYEWDLQGDVEYLRILVSELLANYPRADRRICIAGMSGGARMACRFTSLHSESVQVLGAVAGLRAPGQTELAHPVRVVAFHGTTDRINPFAGSGTERWHESVPSAAAAWARALGLPDEPTRQVTGHLTQISFGDPEAPDGTLFVSDGAGHTWPGARIPLSLATPLALLYMRLILGRTSKDIDATTEIWRATSASAA